MNYVHKPVLVKEVLEVLAPKPGETMVDATVGQAGHTLEILEKNGPEGMVLGIDWDANQVENSTQVTEKYGARMVLVHGSYADITDIVEKMHVRPVDGILLDLGYSSWQLEHADRGFTFTKDEPLDMRYDFENTLTANMIVNEYSEIEIEKILREYGEEKFSQKIAKEIVRERSKKRIESTFALIEVIKKAVPARFHHGRLHVATLTFQALRIAVNKELENLVAFLPQALNILAPSGRLAVISFHSLEDRIVKQFFQEKAKEEKIILVTKKPIIASEGEVGGNPRARSAKLRGFIKV